MLRPARAMWRFLHRDGGDYVFVCRWFDGVTWHLRRAPVVRRVPVERFWGGDAAMSNVEWVRRHWRNAVDQSGGGAR